MWGYGVPGGDSTVGAQQWGGHMSKIPACNPLAAPCNAALSAPLTLHPYVPTDGTPLSELSWSSSLAVVAVSFSGLFTFIFLMLACLCCKKGDIGFKVRAGHPAWAGGCSSHWGLPVPCHCLWDVPVAQWRGSQLYPSPRAGPRHG